jgi:signal transduction histidine kinase
MHLVDPVRYEQLKGTGPLPSPAGIALAIVRLMQRDDYKIDDLVRLVQSDPAIAGELLKFSNAASFGYSRPIVSLSKAITMLGAFRVRILVLALSVLHNHRSGHCPRFDYERFWSRALAAAISAQALASYAKINAEENFTAGLLCTVGELALASIFPERYCEIISVSNDGIHKRLALEREAFDTDHRELAATLLLEWGVPEVLATAIYHCEAPDEAYFLDGSRIYGLTLSLHVALAIAEICVADDEARWAMLPNLYAKAARLGIGTQELNSIADAIIPSWQEWGKLLGIQTHEIISFADLLASSQPTEQVSTSLVSIESAISEPTKQGVLLDSFRDITAHKLVEQKLAASYRKLQQLAMHLAKVREEEQGRIAREIHDEMGATLTALKMRVHWLASRMPAEMAQFAAEAEHMDKLVADAIHTMRRVVSQLMPIQLHDLGFSAAVGRYVQDFQKHTKIECVLALPEEELMLDENQSSAMFRILQESLNNVAKHAQATKVRILFIDRNHSLILLVQDNGVGFDRNTHKGNSFGLLGIKERVLMVNGKARISSKPGKGTQVVVSIPLAESSMCTSCEGMLTTT